MIIILFFQDALNDGHAIVATLGDIFSGDGHCVLIYAAEGSNFKIKDSHGYKYDIPINRPDFLQVNKKILKVFQKSFLLSRKV